VFNDDPISNLTGKSKDSLQLGCPVCDRGDTTVRFNWKLSLETPEGEYGRYTRTLFEKKALKAGRLFECPTCQRSWYLEGSWEMMCLVPEDKLSLVEEWGSAPLNLPPELMAKAGDIGATPSHQLSGEKNYAEVPCKVLTRQGDWIDKCLLAFKLSPPMEEYFLPARLFKDVADIQPSDYALPLEVRSASSLSAQVRPGRATTDVETAEGRRFLLNWTVNFFDRDGVQGKDLRLAAGKPKRGKGRVALAAEPLKEITFFFGDWSENLRELF
jgi:hypothetical protein